MTSKQATLINWRISTGQKQHRSQPTISESTSNTTTSRPSTQVRLDINTNDLCEHQHWGHKFVPKDEETEFRLILRNISSLPQDSKHNKNDLFINEIISTQADIYCANEINLAWQHLSTDSKLFERFKGKLEFAKYVSSNNKDQSFVGTFQPGGTLTVTTGNICGRIFGAGQEDHVLQRWSWIHIRGKNQHKLAIINLYRPVKANGPLSTYQQHKRILLEQDIDTCPRKQLLEALGTVIDMWKRDGFSIIVAGDFNEAINSNQITQFFQRFNMQELILQQHGTKAPNTMIQGTQPIDGIFGTADLHAVRSGYMSFDWGIASDHRILWLDLNYVNTLGTNSPPLWRPGTRRLKCNDPRIVKQFNALRHKFLKKSKLYEFINQFPPPEEFQLLPNWQTLLEECDKIRCDSMEYADRHCRKLKMGKVQWSPELQTIMLRISYLQRCRLKYIKGYEVNSRTLYKAFTRTDYTTKYEDRESIISQLKIEFTNYNKLKKDAETLRYNFLEQLAEAKADHSTQKKSSIYKQLLSHEAIRNTFRKIKTSIKDPRSSTTVVEAQANDGSWQVVTDKQEIENQCIQENIRRLTQASTTPTMLQSQIDIFGSKADTQRAEEILKGELVNTEGVHPSIQKMAPYLTTPTAITQLPPIRHDITTTEYVRMWKRNREYTSTGTSGLHFGHFQASCEDTQLCSFDKRLLEITLHTGYTLQRWYKGIDVMIPKKIGSNRVDKLRTIVLMEPDCNFGNKIIGKRVMAMAEKAGTIAPEQFGSRKKKSSIIHAVNKQITTDILRQDRKDFCMIILDAKQCYDRITHLYAAFALKRQGASTNMVNILFDTISNMEHQIRTSFGDSDSTYKQSDNRFHGILQGNGAGPTIWAMISTTMLDRLRDKGIGATIQTAKGHRILIPAFAFVDDADLIQELHSQQDVTSPQQAVSEWNEGLSTSGGLLVGDKCSFQVIRHTWKNNKWHIENVLDERMSINITNDMDQTSTIKQNLPNQGEIALGIAFSPTGCMKDEVTHLRKKTSTWAEKIVKAPIQHHEAWIALTRTIFKTVEYALPATIMTKKELHYSIAPAINAGLSKSGICCKTARKIVFGTNQFQGLGIRDPFVTQGIKKLELIFHQGNILTRELIHESWIRCTKEIGIGLDIFQHDYNIYKAIITKSWISSLWEFLEDTKIVLKRTKVSSPLRMIGDVFLNQAVFASNEWSPNDKVEFNNCRMFLGVELLSDIITANGTSIRSSCFQGIIQSTSEQFIKYNAKVPRPTGGAWNTWRKMLKKTFHTNEQGILTQGVAPINQSSNWQWFLQVSTDRVYRKQENKWQLYTMINTSRRTRNKSYRLHSADATPPDRIVPITTYESSQYIKIDGIGTSVQNMNEHKEIEWTDTICHKIVGDTAQLISWMEKEQIILLSDGSVKSTSSMAAWIVTTPNAFGNNVYIQGYGKIFEKADSHRAECFGILGAIHTFLKYKQLWNLQYHIPIKLVCDNKAAINYVGDSERYPYIHSKFPDFDVLQSIRTALYNESTQYQHVKGHGEKSDRPWDIYTTINIQVDELADDAEALWQENPNSFQEYSSLVGEEWQVHCNGKKIFKELDETIRQFVTETSIPDVWHKYKRVSKEWFNEVNWKAIGSVMKQSSNSTRQWIIKRCAQECGSNAVRYRRKEIDNNECPFCKANETIEHVYKCKHRDVEEEWNKALHELEEYLHSIQTDPNITRQLLLGINMWRNDETLTQEPMIIDQNNIGWNGIMEGVLGKHWAEEQDWYKQQQSEVTSGRKWAQLVIRRLWKIAWDIWQHRNEMEHKHDQQIELQRLRELANTEIEVGPKGYGTMQFLFTPDMINKVMNGNRDYVANWIRSVQVRRQRHERIEKQSGAFINMRNMMRRFLLGEGAPS
jgi:Reverse transcriptase (RNA-dependent DNA polymerase)